MNKYSKIIPLAFSALLGPTIVEAGPIVELHVGPSRGSSVYTNRHGFDHLTSGGNVTRWTIKSDLTGTGFEWLGGLDDTFASVCLEPGEHRRQGYFELLPLALGPTDPGAMGSDSAEGLERLFTHFKNSGKSLNIYGPSALSGHERAALQMAAWESSQEIVGGYDRLGGSFKTWTNSMPSWPILEAYDAVVTSDLEITVEGFAMIAVNADGSDRRGQDFAFYNPNPVQPVAATSDTVPVPAPLALMGLGLAGLGFTRYRARRA